MATNNKKTIDYRPVEAGVDNRGPFIRVEPRGNKGLRAKLRPIAGAWAVLGGKIAGDFPGLIDAGLVTPQGELIR